MRQGIKNSTNVEQYDNVIFKTTYYDRPQSHGVGEACNVSMSCVPATRKACQARCQTISKHKCRRGGGKGGAVPSVGQKSITFGQFK